MTFLPKKSVWQYKLSQELTMTRLNWLHHTSNMVLLKQCMSIDVKAVSEDSFTTYSLHYTIILASKLRELERIE